MSVPLLTALPGNDSMAEKLAPLCGAALGKLETRTFPDGESYLRFSDSPASRSLVLVSTLDRPNEKIMPLLFAAQTARELGAHKVGLVAPYLGYMRQDRRFRPGEAVTSRIFAALLSRSFDWLATVDPHLHRIGSLAEIYTVKTRELHAGELMANWIKENVEKPFLIGPDAESEQWISQVARNCDADFLILRKERLGDRIVHVAGERLERLASATPVLLDDIISSGNTMLEAIRLVQAASKRVPVVIAVHGVFADNSDLAISNTGARLVTANSVTHASNAIDLASLLARGVGELL